MRRRTCVSVTPAWLRIQDRSEAAAAADTFQFLRPAGRRVADLMLVDRCLLSMLLLLLLLLLRLRLHVVGPR